jgi:hypothetical protein
LCPLSCPQWRLLLSLLFSQDLVRKHVCDRARKTKGAVRRRRHRGLGNGRKKRLWKQPLNVQFRVQIRVRIRIRFPIQFRGRFHALLGAKSKSTFLNLPGRVPGHLPGHVPGHVPGLVPGCSGHLDLASCISELVRPKIQLKTSFMHIITICPLKKEQLFFPYFFLVLKTSVLSLMPEKVASNLKSHV